MVRRIAGFIFARYFFAKIILGLIASTIILFTFIYEDFDKFELVTLDQRFKLRPARPVDENIVLIEMADDSINAIGRWPWPREWHATILSILKKYEAEQVIFDIIFDEPSQPTQDLVFSEAIKRAGNVYLPYVFQFKKGDMPIKNEPYGNVRNILYPLEDFKKAAKGMGHVNVAPDIDGTIRRAPLIMEHEGKLYPQIAFKAAMDYLKDDYKDVPLDSNNQLLISWAGKWKDTFKHYSYIDIITSYNQVLNNEKPIVDLNSLKGKICIVGLAASGLYDIRPIPLEASYPVVGMNANIINNVINRDFITKTPKFIDILLIYLMSLLVALIVSKARFIRGAVYTFFVIFGYIVIIFFLFTMYGKWVVLVYPGLAMLISFLVVTLYNEVVLALERKKYFDLSIRDGLTKLFNVRHFKDILAKEFAMSSGKRKTRRLCLIMADVDYFKNFNDTYGHQVGDFVLKRVAHMFKQGSRSHDVAARYGGEEFIMMLPGTDIEDAKNIAERIRENIENTPFRRHNETYSVTVSLGAAMLEEEATKEEFIKKVDEVLYMAKKTGRNRVCWK